MTVTHPDFPWRIAGCFGKERFASGAKAKKAQRQIEKRTKRPGNSGQHNGAVEAYRCQFCGSWHIGRKQRHAKR